MINQPQLFGVDQNNSEGRLFPDLTNEEYHQGEGYSSSKLKKLLELTPAKFKHEQENSERKPNKVFDTGSATHCKRLEPQNFKRDFVVSPTFNLQTKAGRAFRDEFYREHAGKIIIDEIQDEQSSAMAEAIDNNPLARSLLDGAIVEQSIFWDIVEPVTGQPITLKVRPDAVCKNYPHVIDIKTCTSAAYQDAQKAILNYKYHLSGSLYLDGVNRCGDLLRQTNCLLYNSFIFIFVENEPPYQTAIYELSAELLAIGDAMIARALHNLGNAILYDWPAYPTHIRTIDAPPWAKKLPLI